MQSPSRKSNCHFFTTTHIVTSYETVTNKVTTCWFGRVTSIRNWLLDPITSPALTTNLAYVSVHNTWRHTKQRELYTHNHSIQQHHVPHLWREWKLRESLETVCLSAAESWPACVGMFPGAVNHVPHNQSRSANEHLTLQWSPTTQVHKHCMVHLSDFY